MKCPLIVHDAIVVEVQDCLKEECAWWDKEDEECSIQRLTGELFTLNIQLGAFLNKIPPDKVKEFLSLK